MIPEGWRSTTVGEVADLIAGGTPSTGVMEYWDGDILWCTPTDITSTEGKTLYQTDRRITQAGLAASAASLLPEGSLLLCTRATVGDVRIAGQPTATNQGFKSLVVKSSNDNVFVYYQLSTLRNRLLELSSGSTFLELSKKDLARVELLMPPLLEQQAIAEALSDADALVESLDALIEKKRDMKQAAMQQLLTGRNRLPGFTDDWTEIAYNELTWHRAGNGSLIKGKVYQESGADRFPAFSASGQDVWCDVAEYTEPGLVISAVGSRCGKVFRASGAWTAIANTHVLFAEKDRCSTDFLWLRVNEEKFWVKGGTGQPFVLVRESLKRRDFWPSHEEQVQIAQVLMDMDAEIDALVAQREKAELVKQGMMQELLSGRVRLV